MQCCGFQSNLYCCFVLVSLTVITSGLLQGLDSKWLEQADKDFAFPVRLNSEGVLTNDLLPVWAGQNRGDATRKKLVVYLFHSFGVDYELQMVPNDELVSPSGLVKTIHADTVERENVDTENLVNERCHLMGKACANEHLNGTKTLWGHAAISVCDGNMSGIIFMPTHELHIEVALEGEMPKKPGHAHVIRRRSTRMNKIENYRYQFTGDNVQDSKTKFIEHLERTAGSRMKRQSPGKRVLYVETVVAIDEVAIDERQMKNRQLQNYVLALMNVANSLWANSATGFDVRLVVKDIKLLKKNPSGIPITTTASRLLKSFCDWQRSPSESSLVPHDYGVLITGNKLCTSYRICQTAGLAYTSTMCSKYACQVVKDNGILTGFAIAHEAGHSFGMEHDGDGNLCGGALRRLMATVPSIRIGLFHWSSCSKQYIQDYLRVKSNYFCLLDHPPSNETTRYEDRWPGSRYDLDMQCTWQTGRASRVCYSNSDPEEVCQMLWCQRGSSCISVEVPALDGSVCGQGKVCVQGQCVLESEKDDFTLGDRVHGGWGEWSRFSSCSRSCGGGLRHQERLCNRPSPSDGGRFCKGDHYKVELCNNLPCVTDPINPRVIRCLHEIGGDGEPMEPYYNVKDPCTLYCVNSSTGEQVNMRESIVNAEKCNPNIPSNDRCFRGQCQKFGCNNKKKSNMVEDKCNVCQGSNRTCEDDSGTFRSVITSPGYHEVVEIPSRATNIFIEEISFLKDLYLAVQLRSSRGRVYVVNGNNQPGNAWQRVDAAGTVIEYSRPSYANESIRMKGPLDVRIIIWALVTQSQVSLLPIIKWKYSLPLDGNDRGLGKKSYIWVKSESRCSKTCRGGYREVEFLCRATANDGGLVNYRFCNRSATEPPKTQRIECNTDVVCRRGPRPVYRWHVGNWSQCSATCGTGQQERNVSCYDETYAQYVDKWKCQYSAPTSTFTRPCTLPACQLKPVDGGWSNWKASGGCSRGCGSGVSLETRTCTNPIPKDGGKPCVGTDRRHVCCNTEACRYSVDEFTEQCRMQYPESDAVFSHTGWPSCQIQCKLKSGSVNTINAEDGTRCDLRSSKRCLNRVCEMVGCDCVYGFANIPSACGLCSNQAAKCIEISAKYRIQQAVARDYHILDVPKGAYRVRIDMKKESNIAAEIIVTSSGSRRRITSRDGSGFAFGGEVSYTRNHTANRESLEFYGPIEGDLGIFMELQGKVGSHRSPSIDVSYIISSEYRRKAEQYNHPYGWSLAKTSCTVTCGSRVGVEGSEAQCAYKETGARAPMSRCLRDYKPLSHTTRCRGVSNCPGVVWQTGSWSSCRSSCGQGVKTRAVRCVDQTTRRSTKRDLCSFPEPSAIQECFRTRCEQRPTPATTRPTTLAPTTRPLRFQWSVKSWKSCSATCGTGYQIRAVRCIDTKTRKSKKSSRCVAELKPTGRQTCVVKQC